MGDSTPCHPACARWTVSIRTGGAVEVLQEVPPLVLRFLASVPLNVPVQELDGRVEGVVGAALISL